MKKWRTEQDSMGEVEVPMEALYGAQTQRAVNNFTISSQPMHWRFLSALLHIKEAAAITNGRLGLLDTVWAECIAASCRELLGEGNQVHFPVPVYQTGSGTSSNMNINEVIAGRCRQKGVELHPNDHVNMGQSSNDVVPSALLLSSAVAIQDALQPTLASLAATIRGVGQAHRQVLKTGRTHLMDAMPIWFSAEVEAWAVQLEESGERLTDTMGRLGRLPLGGTAVGSGVNCHPDFAELAIASLAKWSGIRLSRAPSAYKGLSSLDTPLELSGQLKTLAMTLFKIANDLRWMNSGPLSGLGEISLPPLQPGSSIMPAKVNPVIPEAVCMAAAQVAGFDTANTIAAQSGNFQLNTMLPLVAQNLLNAIDLLAGCCRSLEEKVFTDLKVDERRCAEML